MKRYLSALLMIWLSLGLTTSTHSQKRIYGTVHDAETEAILPGASVVLEATQVGIFADANGAFELDLWQLPAVIRISHIGYRAHQKIVSEDTESAWSIALTPETLMLDEIVVTAYHDYLRQFTKDGGWDGTWSPDGQTIAFVKVHDRNADIWIQPADSGAAVRWTHHPAWDASPAWSPDGKTLAFTSYRDDTLNVWIRDMENGTAKRVTSGDDQVADDLDYGPRFEGGPVAWTPTSKQIVFSKKDRTDWEKRYSRQFWQKSIDIDNDAHPLVTDAKPRKKFDFQSCAVWSPDMTRIAFMDSHRQGIFVTASDGTQNAKRLGPGQAPTWSPDGQWLAFTRSDSNGVQDIWVQNVNEKNPIRLTHSPSKQESTPRWSPDGQHLLFGMRDAGYDLWIMTIPGGKPIRLASGIAAADWSPDGEAVGFIAYTDQGLTLFKMAASGGAWTALSEPGTIPVPVGGLSWSPNGRLFAGVTYGRQNELWKFTLETGQRMQIMDAHDLKVFRAFWQHSTPTWSPDGEWIAVTALLGTWLTHIQRISEDGRMSEYRSFLRLYGGDSDKGKDIRRWIFHDTREALGELHPSWSPDGTTMAFTFSTVPDPDTSAVGEKAARTIWTAPVEGGTPTWIAEGFWPAWSPDGQTILFLREESQTGKGEFRSLWSIPSTGGPPQKILSNISGLIDIKWSSTGNRILYLTPPDDNLWIMSLKGTQFKSHLENLE